MSQVYNVIGKSHTRIDGMAKVMGSAKFAADVQLPNMLYCKVLKSPYPHANITSIDTSKALALPGVKAVISFKDVPPVLFGSSSDQYPLTDKARFVGDQVAAVAATSENIAEDALDSIVVQYQQLPAYFNSTDAMASGAVPIHPELASTKTSNIIGGGPYTYKAGDVTAGFAQADKTFEVNNWLIDYVTCATLENHGSVAAWDGDKLTLYTATSGGFFWQEAIAPVLGIPISHVRIVTPVTGGAFGSKGSALERINLITALLAKKAGRPVKLEYTREDQLTVVGSRAKGVTQSMKLGVKNDGTLTACQMNLTFNVGAYAVGGSAIFSAITACLYPYVPFANALFTAYPVYTNCPPSGGMRGWGKEEGSHQFEVLMDMAAEGLGMDVVDLHQKNFYKVGAKFGSTTFTSCGIPDAVSQAATRFGWKSKWTAPSKKTGTVRTGVGMSVHVRTGSLAACEAIVKVDRDGSVTIINGAMDNGNCQKTSLAMVAAEILGIDTDMVGVSTTDTTCLPNAARSGASVGFMSNGKAVQLAAEDAKAQILAKAAAVLSVPAASLSLGPGKVYVTATPTQSVTYQSLISAQNDIIGVGKVTSGMGGNLIASQACFAEVQVNTETGKVFVTNFVGANDMGYAINPDMIVINSEGGDIQCIGTTLLEGMIDDPINGARLNANFLDYKIPTIVDYGTMDCSILVNPISPPGAFGAAGGQESMGMSPTPAILNAIYNAIGKRITETPVKPSSILKALGGS